MGGFKEALTKREFITKIGGFRNEITPAIDVFRSTTTSKEPSKESDSKHAFSRRTFLRGAGVAAALTLIPGGISIAADRMAGLPNPLAAKTVYAAEPKADGGVDQPVSPDVPQPISLITPDNPQGIAGLEKNGRRALQEIAGGIGFDPATQQITINTNLDTTNVPPGKYSGLYVNIGNSDEPAELHVQYVSDYGWTAAFRSTPTGQKETTINKGFNKKNYPVEDITITIKNGKIITKLGTGETLSFNNTPVELTKTGVINIGAAVTGGPLVINNLNYLVESLPPEPPMETSKIISPDQPVVVEGSKRYGPFPIPQEIPIKATADIDIKPMIDLTNSIATVGYGFSNGLSGENVRWFQIYAVNRVGGWFFGEGQTDGKYDRSSIFKLFDCLPSLTDAGKKIEIILNADGKTGTVSDVSVPNSPQKKKFVLSKQFFPDPGSRQIVIVAAGTNNVKETISSLVIGPAS